MPPVNERVEKVKGLVPLCLVCVLSLVAIVTFSVIKVTVYPDNDRLIMIDAGSSGTRCHVFKWKNSRDLEFPHVEEISSERFPVALSSYVNNTRGLADDFRPVLDFAYSAIAGEFSSSVPVYVYATAGMRIFEGGNSRQEKDIDAIGNSRHIGNSRQEKDIDVIGNSRHIGNSRQENATEKVMDDLYDVISMDTRFAVKGRDAVRVISGAEEGVFGWITVNYLTGALEAGKEDGKGTMGALDLGGASTQITFEPKSFGKDDVAVVDDDANMDTMKTADRNRIVVDTNGDTLEENTVNLTVAGRSFKLYTHSYLYLGIDQVRYSINATADHKGLACYPRGYVLSGVGNGTGDYDKCLELMNELVQGSKQCDHHPLCGARGVDQPSVTGEQFMLFSAYFSELNDILKLNFTAVNGTLGPTVGGEFTIAEVEKATKQFCSEDFASITSRFKDSGNEKYAFAGCLGGALIVELLRGGYKFPDPSIDPKQLVAAQKVDGVGIGWALGAAIYEASLIPFGEQSEKISAGYKVPVEYIFGAAIGVFLISFVAIIAICLVTGKIWPGSKSNILKHAQTPLLPQ